MCKIQSPCPRAPPPPLPQSNDYSINSNPKSYVLPDQKSHISLSKLLKSSIRETLGRIHPGSKFLSICGKLKLESRVSTTGSVSHQVGPWKWWEVGQGDWWIISSQDGWLVSEWWHHIENSGWDSSACGLGIQHTVAKSAFVSWNPTLWGPCIASFLLPCDSVHVSIVQAVEWPMNEEGWPQLAKSFYLLGCKANTLWWLLTQNTKIFVFNAPCYRTIHSPLCP